VIGAFELAVQGIADLAPSAATTGTGISSREGV
jgi:hypothetical protein